MDIICAGYWKTGSKSCSSALRELGYNVADAVDTGKHLTQVWLDFIEEKCEISDVIAEYKRHNFHANQDYPGNFMWEDLYNESPNAKVILTVRDSDDDFMKSFTNFMRQEHERFGDPLMYFLQKFQDKRFGGRKDADFTLIKEYCMKTYVMPGMDPKRRFFTIKNTLKYFESHHRVLRQGYNRHIAYIKAVVPAERLLVWNVKEGWEPLCKFLGKPIPDKPIPHDNKTGDKKFMEEYIFKSEFGKEMVNNYQKNVTIWFLKYIGMIALVALEYKSGWEHTKIIGNYLYQTVSNYL